MAQHRFILLLRVGYPWDRLPRHHQNMHRGAGLDVMEGKDVLVLINESGGDLAISDFLEQRFAHNRDLPGYCTSNAQLEPLVSFPRQVRRYSIIWSFKL